MQYQDQLQLANTIDTEARSIHEESLRILERLRDLAIEAHDDVTATQLNLNILDLQRLLRVQAEIETND